MIYEPAEDSYFFKRFLENNFRKVNCKPLSFLDMGTGSGILAKTAKELGFCKIVAVDINKEALIKFKEEKIEKIESNLFENIKGRFDIIIFNAPYLPRDNREPKDSQIATTGGKEGDEISVEFLKKTKEHLNKKGKVYLLISSLTPDNKINKFNPREVATKKIDFEKLRILEFNEDSF